MIEVEHSCRDLAHDVLGHSSGFGAERRLGNDAECC
jgi:hypothetical protein